MITLSDIKLHCRIDVDDTTEDALLTRYYTAAKQTVSNHVDRKLYDAGEVIPDEDTKGIHVNEALEQAMLLAIGHFYENRESVTEGKNYSLPLGYWSLIQPYRHMGV